MNRLEGIRAFIEVADRGSFVEAARARRMSAAAASRAIAALERELGVALLRRTTRSVSLTSEGAAYLEQCRHAIAVLDDAERALRGKNAEPGGLLVVTAPVVFGRMHILPITARLLRDHSALGIDLVLTDRIVRLADEGVDVAVRIADLTDSSLLGVRVGETKRVLVASPAYLADRGTPTESHALRNHDLIEFDSPVGEWRFTERQHSKQRTEPRLRTNSIEAAIDAAVAGLGLTRVLCYQVREHLAAGRLVQVLAEQSPPPVPISLLFQANRQSSPNVRAFIDATKTELRLRLS